MILLSYQKLKFFKEIRTVFMHLVNRFTEQQVVYVDCLPALRISELHECLDEDKA